MVCLLLLDRIIATAHVQSNDFHLNVHRGLLEFAYGVKLEEHQLKTVISVLQWSDRVNDMLDRGNWESRNYTNGEQRKPSMVTYLFELAYHLMLDWGKAADYTRAPGFEGPLGYFAWLKDLAKAMYKMTKFFQSSILWLYFLQNIYSCESPSKENGPKTDDPKTFGPLKSGGMIAEGIIPIKSQTIYSTLKSGGNFGTFFNY